jgi:hypothetical protein
MIEKRTVFILGAGASRPYGLPTANELRRDIIQKFRKNYGNHLIARRETEEERVRRGYPTISDATEFLRVFDGPNERESIDLFLSRRPQFGEIGKLAILLSILGRERENASARANEPHHDWYSLLYERMTREMVSKDGFREFGRNNVAFITFNYDRSLEHFLFRSLHSFENATRESVREQIDQITISHVYGKVSPLEWQDNDGSKVLKYGADDSGSYDKLPGMIQNLYVVRDERMNPEIEKAREEIREAERIFFLGFGYADENLAALGIPDSLKAGQFIYGTAMGRRQREIHDIRSRFIDGLRRAGDRSVGPERVEIHDCDCVGLLRDCL